MEKQGTENSKGAYWTIQPEQLAFFQDGAFRRRRCATTTEAVSGGEEPSNSRKRRRSNSHGRKQNLSSSREALQSMERMSLSEWTEELHAMKPSQATEDGEGSVVSWAEEVLYEGDDYDDPNMPALEWTPINGLSYVEGQDKILLSSQWRDDLRGYGVGSELDWSFMISNGANILTSDLLYNHRF